MDDLKASTILVPEGQGLELEPMEIDESESDAPERPNADADFEHNLDSDHPDSSSHSELSELSEHSDSDSLITELVEDDGDEHELEDYDLLNDKGIAAADAALKIARTKLQARLGKQFVFYRINHDIVEDFAGWVAENLIASKK